MFRYEIAAYANTKITRKGCFTYNPEGFFIYWRHFPSLERFTVKIIDNEMEALDAYYYYARILISDKPILEDAA